MPEPILEQLSKGPVLGDGGYVVILKEQGVPMEKYTPHGILTHGRLVRALYQGFLDAGAEVITAQTFFWSRARLRQTGNEDKFEEIHRVAVEMAREVAGDKALVAGAVTSAIGFDRSLASLEESYADCREESDLLIDLGVDFLILEGFWYVDEARAALKAAVEAAASKDVAVMVTVPFRSRKTQDGHDPDECARVIRDEGADIIGIHCERDPENMYPVIEPMQRAVDIPIAMQPIAIRCAPSDYWNRADGFWTGRVLPPEAMADYARRAGEMGIQYIGSCCGSGPEHVRAMAEALGKQVRNGGNEEKR